MAIDAPRPLGRAARAADLLLRPVMWAVGGFRRDSVQETHRWHCAAVDPNAIDLRLVVAVEGDDESRRLNRPWAPPLFHVPVLGGWRNFVTLEVGEPLQRWHIGWIHL